MECDSELRKIWQGALNFDPQNPQKMELGILGHKQQQ
jgi:hypothetical protein